jgi:hypothetical protein
MKFKKEDVIIYKGVENLKVNILDFNDSKITYEVINTPIHSFDQHSRARVGHKFFDIKIDQLPVYTMYTATFNNLISNDEKLNEFLDIAILLEDKIQNAEFKKPYYLMSRNMSYKVEQDYTSLAGQIGRRLKFCEEETIVAVFWQLRQKMIDSGIEFAKDYLPGCDKTGKCDYIDVSDHLSSLFNSLFASCGRWKTDENIYRSFNESCTTPRMLIDQLNLEIPKSKWEIESNIKY